VPGLPIIEIGCFISIPYRLRCICAGNMIFEYGFAFIIAWYIRADNSKVCPIVFCGDYCSILFSSFEKSMTSPNSDLSLSILSAIMNSSFMSVLSVSIEISWLKKWSLNPCLWFVKVWAVPPMSLVLPTMIC